MTSVYRAGPASSLSRQSELFVYLLPQHADQVISECRGASVRFLYRANTRTQGEEWFGVKEQV